MQIPNEPALARISRSHVGGFESLPVFAIELGAI